MQRQQSTSRRVPRLRPLAAIAYLLTASHGIAATTAAQDPAADDRFALEQRYANAMTFGYPAQALAPSPQASTVFVQNCNDAGSGSLRAAIGAAQSGDTVDLTHLACTRITLTTGQITVPQTSLTISGSGVDQSVIDGGASGGHFNRIFNHTGGGTLQVNKVTLTDAKYKADTHGAVGGCIYSRGSVSLSQAQLSGCFAEVTPQEPGNFGSFGGALYARGVVLLHSTVSGNFGIAPSMHTIEGGGVYCRGNLTVKYSDISNNSADNDYGRGGGIVVQSGDAFILSSTLAGNIAGAEAAMNMSQFDHLPHTAQILNSTISGNHARYGDAGFISTYTDVVVANSTITLNRTDRATNGNGLRVLGPQAVRLQSSIIANNSGDGSDSDLLVDMRATLEGNNNLIMQYVGTPPPTDTISLCPLLAPLADNGGETASHRLLAGSPAIDAGNNTERGFDFDQRGTGYPRTHNGKPDIGAFEDQGVMPNVIFTAGFEGRCR